jgi:hypothetical protein
MEAEAGSSRPTHYALPASRVQVQATVQLEGPTPARPARLGVNTVQLDGAAPAPEARPPEASMSWPAAPRGSGAWRSSASEVSQTECQGCGAGKACCSTRGKPEELTASPCRTVKLRRGHFLGGHHELGIRVSQFAGSTTLVCAADNPSFSSEKRADLCGDERNISSISNKSLGQLAWIAFLTGCFVFR